MPASAFAVSETLAVISFPHAAAAPAHAPGPAHAARSVASPQLPGVPGPLAEGHYSVFKDIRPVDHALPMQPTEPHAQPLVEAFAEVPAKFSSPQLTSTAAALPAALLAHPVRMPRAYAGSVRMPVAMPVPPAPALTEPHARQQDLGRTSAVAESSAPLLPMPPLEARAWPDIRPLVAPAPVAWQPAQPVAIQPTTVRPPASAPVFTSVAQPTPSEPVSRLGDYVPAEALAVPLLIEGAADRAVPPVVLQQKAQPVKPRASLWATAKRVLKYLLLAVAAYGAFVLLALIVFRFVNPPTSALMVQQRFSGQDIIQEWTPLESISPNVVRAVLVSEDGRFCQHNGIDFEEMQAAIERAADGPARGASTISMQVVKNLFLWPAKSYIRKAIEIPLTYIMELLWPKRRIMEVYLNIAEWGPGIFGVEAASQFHFNKHATRLTEREAARLAVALPNPYIRDAGDPGPQTMRLAGEVQSRMHAAPASQTGCVLSGGG